jgi:subtilisin family serine protease
MHLRRLGSLIVCVVVIQGAMATAPVEARPGPTSARAHRARVIVDAADDGLQRVLVSYRPEAARTATARDAVERRIGAKAHRVTRRYNLSPVVVVEADAAQIERIARDPDVVSVIADTPQPPADLESNVLIGATASVASGIDGTGTAVAVLDTGVDGSHPFLAGKVVAEACFAASSSCPNGGVLQVGPGSAVACTYAVRGCRHGTHVAGIAAGRHTDTIPFDGVAPGANIIAVQVFTRFEGDVCLLLQNESPCTLSLTSDRIAGLEFVAWMTGSFNVVAANMSIGGGMFRDACDFDPEKPIIDLLRQLNVATTISAGNDGSSTDVSAPGCISSAVTVGATTKLDAYASFTNSNPLVDVVAPGVAINSSIPGGGIASFNGTSMAAPHVMGAFALARQLHPNQSLATTQTQIVNSGPVLIDARNGLGFHRLDVMDAFHAVQIDPGFTVISEGDGGMKVASIPIVLSRPSTLPVSVSVTPFPITTDNADLTASEQVVNFAPGDAAGSYDVQLNGDTSVEGDEVFLVILHAPSNGAVGGFFGLGVLVIDEEPGG